MVKEMQTAFPVLSKQKKPATKPCVDTVPFQVSAPPEKKRDFFFPLWLFLFFPFYRHWNKKRRECREKINLQFFNSQKKHVDLCILQFVYFFQMKNHLNNDAFKNNSSIFDFCAVLWIFFFFAIVVSRRWAYIKKSLKNIWVLLYSLWGLKIEADN